MIELTFDANWYEFVESILNDKNLEACVDRLLQVS